MEATGVYHESLAYFLEEKGYEVSIVLPNKISNYMPDTGGKNELPIKQLQKPLRGLAWKENWIDGNDLKRYLKRLRQLTRERDQVVEERTVGKKSIACRTSRSRTE